MTTKKSIDLLGLGVCTLDLLTVVERFSAEETVQPALDSVLMGGGPVATAMATAARLGTSTAMLDRLGDDWRGRQIRAELEEIGVAMDWAAEEAGSTSSIASILVRQGDGARQIAYSAGSARELTPDDIDPELIASAKILHTNGRHWEAMTAAAQISRQQGVLVSFDGGANRFREPMREFLKLVDIAIVAEDFARKCTGEESLEAAAAHLHEAGPSLVVITSGKAGSWVSPKEDQSFHQPAYLLDGTVDTTGCGDVYHGAFLAALTQDCPLEVCARNASAAAALNSLALGGRGNLPTLEEVTKLVNAAPPA